MKNGMNWMSRVGRILGVALLVCVFASSASAKFGSGGGLTVGKPVYSAALKVTPNSSTPSYQKVAEKALFASKIKKEKLQELVIINHLNACESEAEAKLYLTALGYASGYSLGGTTIKPTELAQAIALADLVNMSIEDVASGIYGSTDEALISIWDNDSQIANIIDLETLEFLMNGGLENNIDELMGVFIDPAIGMGGKMDQMMAEMDNMMAKFMAIVESSMCHGFDWGGMAGEAGKQAVITGIVAAAMGAVVGGPGAAAGAGAVGALGGALTGALNYTWDELEKKKEEEEEDEAGSTEGEDKGEDEGEEGGVDDECFPPIFLDLVGLSFNQDQSDFIYTIQLDYLNVLNTHCALQPNFLLNF